MPRLTKEERVIIVEKYFETKSHMRVQAAFQQRFQITQPQSCAKYFEIFKASDKKCKILKKVITIFSPFFAFGEQN